MDRIDEMRVFIRVSEARSFRTAARDLGLPPSTVTEVIKRTEARLGTRLLDRTTRVVAPTLDGEAWYRRCLTIVGAVEDAEAAFRGGEPQGRVRLDIGGALARYYVLPGLPAFLARYPKLDLVLSEGERLVDLVREGVDCVVRTGAPVDSDLIMRRLGELTQVTVATPEYLARVGAPRSPDDLDGHRMVGFLSTRTDTVLPLDFVVGGQVVERRLPTFLVVTGAELMVEAALQGLGLMQGPRYRLREYLQDGRLCEVLPSFPPLPMPLSVQYPRDRQLSPRVRVLIDWLASIDLGG